MDKLVLDGTSAMKAIWNRQWEIDSLERKEELDLRRTLTFAFGFIQTGPILSRGMTLKFKWKGQRCGF